MPVAGGRVEKISVGKVQLMHEAVLVRLESFVEHPQCDGKGY